MKFLRNYNTYKAYFCRDIPKVALLKFVLIVLKFQLFSEQELKNHKIAKSFKISFSRAVNSSTGEQKTVFKSIRGFFRGNYL
jgi:hypothetical protein